MVFATEDPRIAGGFLDNREPTMSGRSQSKPPTRSAGQDGPVPANIMKANDLPVLVLEDDEIEASHFIGHEVTYLLVPCLVGDEKPTF